MRILALAILTVTTLLTAARAAAQQEKVLHSYGGGTVFAVKP